MASCLTLTAATLRESEAFLAYSSMLPADYWDTERRAGRALNDRLLAAGDRLVIEGGN